MRQESRAKGSSIQGLLDVIKAETEKRSLSSMRGCMGLMMAAILTINQWVLSALIT